MALAACIMAANAATPDPAKELEKRAKKGDITAMVQMGDHYNCLRPANYDNSKKAAGWYKKAMEKGSVEGRVRYALIMAEGSTGKVKEKDAIKAVTGLTNDSVAQVFFERGIRQSRSKAGQALLYCAATMGSPQALYELALLYDINAMLIKKEWSSYNLTKAIQLMEDAGSRNFVPALVWVVDAYSSRRKEPDNERKWRSRLYSVSAGNVSVDDAVFAAGHFDRHSVAIIYRLLSQGKTDSEALQLAEEAARRLDGPYRNTAINTIISNMPQRIDRGVYDRMMEVGGKGLDDNAEKHMLMAGTYLGDEEAVMDVVTKMLNSTAYNEAEHAAAEEQLTRMAAAGDKRATWCLIRLLMRFPEGSPRTADAIPYLLKLADSGDAEAQGTLGGLYAEGRGVTSDTKEARKWLDRAAKGGMPEFKEKYQYLYESKKPAPKKQKRTTKPARPKPDTEFLESGMGRKK